MSRNMDNFSLDVLSEDEEDFKAAIAIAFRDHKATHYRVIDLKDEGGKSGRSLVLYWHSEGREGLTPLPYTLTGANAAAFIWGWLAGQDVKDYVGWLDMDGDCSPCGFRIFTQAWGMVGSDHAAFVAIQPHYVWRGK